MFGLYREKRKENFYFYIIKKKFQKRTGIEYSEIYGCKRVESILLVGFDLFKI